MAITSFKNPDGSTTVNDGTYGGSPSAPSITSDMLTPQPKMAVPQPTVDLTPYDSIIKGAASSLPDVSAQVSTAEAKQKDYLNQLMGVDVTNKEVYSQEQQKLAGVQDRKKELDDLNAQFTDLGAQIDGLALNTKAIPLKIQENNLGTGATDAGVAPQETGMLRQNAIKALTLASQASVLGARVTNTEARLTRAKEDAQLAVDLEFKPKEAAIARLNDLLKLNKDYNLDPAKADKQNATQKLLDERARVLEEQKQNKKDNVTMLVNAQSQNAPASVIDAANKLIEAGAEPSVVAKKLGVYAGDYIGNQAKLASILASQSSTRNNDLQYQINKKQFEQMNALPIGQNEDGTITKGSGKDAAERNGNVVQNVILSKNKIIGEGAKSKIGVALGVIDSIKQLAAENPKGEFGGLYPIGSTFVPNALKSDAGIKNRGLIAAINLKVQQWASGASLTAAQTKKVYEMVPLETDTDRVAKDKANNLANMMYGQVASELESQGVKFRPENSNFFDSGVSSRVRNSLGANYAPKDIVEGLKNDPVWGAKIEEAKQANWSDEAIVNYLQTVQEQPDPADQTNFMQGLIAK